MAEIKLDQVCKRFPDGTDVLKNVSLTIEDGEFFILIGPSGCGKSTLLNCLVGLDTVSSGDIRVDGRVVNELDPKDRNMAMVFQSYAIYPHLTVYDNIAFPLRLAGRNKKEIAEKVAQAAELLELTSLLKRKPAQLSGGQRQRVAMGRALVRNPAVFLLDEPLSNLDARLRVQMRGEIGHLQKQLGTTMIYVTHDQTEALTLGDRVAVLSHGEIQQIGTPQQLYLKPANLFVAGFIGSPTMNVVPAEVRDSKLVLPFGEFHCPENIKSRPQQPLIAGFRPEALSPTTLSTPSQTALAFRINISRVEWLGAELWVHSDLDLSTKMACRSAFSRSDRATVTARLDPAQRVSRGDVLLLQLKWDDIHFFEASTGKRLV